MQISPTKTWDANGLRLRTVPAKQSIHKKFEQLLVICSDGVVRAWQLREGTHGSRGILMIPAVGKPNPHGTAKFVWTHTGACATTDVHPLIQRSAGNYPAATTAAFTATKLYVGYASGDILEFDLSTQQCTRTIRSGRRGGLHPNPIMVVRIPQHQDGDSLVSSNFLFVAKDDSSRVEEGKVNFRLDLYELSSGELQDPDNWRKVCTTTPHERRIHTIVVRPMQGVGACAGTAPCSSAGLPGDSDDVYRVATACADGEARLFEFVITKDKTTLKDVPTLKDVGLYKAGSGSTEVDEVTTIQPVSVHKTDITGLAVSSGNRYLIACGADPRVVKFDMLTGQKLHLFDTRDAYVDGFYGRRVNSVTLTPEDEFMMTCIADGKVLLWDFETNGLVAELGKSVDGRWHGHVTENGRSDVFSCFYEEHGRELYKAQAGDDEKRIRRKKRVTVTGRLELPFGKKQLSAGDTVFVVADAAKHGIWIYTSGADGSVLRFDLCETVTDYRKAKRVCFEAGSSNLTGSRFWQKRSIPSRFSSDTESATSAVTSSAGAQIRIRSRSGKGTAIYSCAFFKATDKNKGSLGGSRYIFTAAGDHSVRQFSIQDDNDDEPYGKEIRVFHGHRSCVNTVILSADNKYVVSGSSDTTCIAFIVATGEIYKRFTNHVEPVYSIRLSADNEYLISVSNDGLVCVDDFETAMNVRKIETPGSGFCRAVRVTHDRKAEALTSELKRKIATIRQQMRNGKPRKEDVLEKHALEAELRHIKATSARDTHMLLAVDDRVMCVDMDTDVDEVSFRQMTGPARINSMCLYEPQKASHEDTVGKSYVILVEESSSDNPVDDNRGVSINGDEALSSTTIKIFDQHSSKLVYDSNSTPAAYQSLSTESNIRREFGAGCLWYGDMSGGRAAAKGGKPYYVVGEKIIRATDDHNIQEWQLTFLKLELLQLGGIPEVDLDLSQSYSMISHTEPITAVVASCDYRYIATGGSDRRVHVVDTNYDRSQQGGPEPETLGRSKDELIGVVDLDDDVREELETQSQGTEGSHSSSLANVSTGPTQSGFSSSHRSDHTGSDARTAHDGEITALHFYQGHEKAQFYLFTAGEEGDVKQFSVSKNEEGPGLCWNYLGTYAEDAEYLKELDAKGYNNLQSKSWWGGFKRKSAVHCIMPVGALSGRREGTAPVLATASDGGVVRLYRIENENDMKMRKNRGKTLAFPVQRFKPKGHVNATRALEAKWDPDGKKGCLLVGGDDGHLMVFEFDDKTMGFMAGDPHSVETDQAGVYVDHPDFDARWQVWRPKFTMSFKSAITGLRIYPTGSARLLVTTDQVFKQERCQLTGRRQELSTLRSLPQLSPLLFEGMLPLCYLRRMALVDANAADPPERFNNVQRAIKRIGPAEVTKASSRFFVELASSGIAIGLKKLLFAFKSDIPCVTVPFSKLAIAQKRGFRNATNKNTVEEGFFGSESVAWGQCFDLILSELAKSVRNHNDVARGLADPALMYSRYNDGGDFVRMLADEKAARANLIAFFDKLPLMISPDAVSGADDTTFVVQRETMLAVTGSSLVEYVWTKKVRRKVQKARFGRTANVTRYLLDSFGAANDDDKRVTAVTLAVPLPGLAVNQNGFLKQALQVRDPRMFGNAAMCALVQDKWDRFGRTWHRNLQLWLILQLVAVVLISFARNAAYPFHWYFPYVCHGILGVGAVTGMAIEIIQLKFGLNWWDYLTFFNLVDWVRVSVTGVAVVIYFTEMEDGDDYHQKPAGYAYDACISIATYLYWFGLLESLKAMHGIGTVVEMVLQALADVRQYMVILFILIMATATANTMWFHASASRLLSLEGSRAEGFQDPFEGFLTTYKELVLADYHFYESEDREQPMPGRWAHAGILIISSFLVTIIILNLIIAKLSDSYVRLKKLADMTRHQYQANMMLTYENLFNSMPKAVSFVKTMSDCLVWPCVAPYRALYGDDSSDNDVGGANAEGRDGHEWLHVMAPRTTRVLNHGRWKRPLEEPSKEMKRLSENRTTVDMATQARLQEVKGQLQKLERAVAAQSQTFEDAVAALIAQVPQLTMPARLTNPANPQVQAPRSADVLRSHDADYAGFGNTLEA